MQKSPRMIGLLAGLIGAALAWWVTPSSASNEDVRFVFHLVEAPAEGDACALAPHDLPCTQAVTNGALETPYFVYLMVAHGDTTAGIGGIVCGIHYPPGIEMQEWIGCGSGLEFPWAGHNGPWPASCSADIINWLLPDYCQRNTIPGYEDQGVLAIAGVFRLVAHEIGELRISYVPQSVLKNGLAVADCSGKSVNFSPDIGQMGSASFGNPYWSGINPCTALVRYPPDYCPDHAPVAPITWGRIKSLYH